MCMRAMQHLDVTHLSAVYSNYMQPSQHTIYICNYIVATVYATSRATLQVANVREKI